MTPSVWLGFILLLAVVFKLILLLANRLPFNADEAIVALMARHILHGERPLFFYGQAYMGSLDAWLVALGFAAFGEQVWVIRLVQSLLYLGTLVTTYALGKDIFHSRQVGLIAALLLAIPSINVTLYTTVSLGGYGEALLIGNLLIWLGWKLIQSLHAGGTGSPWMWFSWGLLAGLGLWAFGITLVYSLPVGFWLLWTLVRQAIQTRRWEMVGRLAWAALGALGGASPWLWFAAQHGGLVSLTELGGGAIAGVEGLPYYQQVWQHLISFLLLGIPVIFGLRPPWSVEWLVLPLLPLALFFWIWVCWNVWRRNNRDSELRRGRRLLFGTGIFVILGFVLTPFGADPSGRYFLPLAIPLALFAADGIANLHVERPGVKVLLVSFILLYNLMGTVQVAWRPSPGLTTQFDAISQIDHRQMGELASFLLEAGERRGYTNYWVSYPLAFQSQEKLIFTPRLPYHQDFRYTERDNRYAPYHDLVEEHSRVAYITTNHPALDANLREGFAALGVTWEEVQIGDYQVFFNLSQPVRPEDIGLGMTTHP